MTAGSNPTHRRRKLGTKRHVLTDKKGIPLSAVMSSASTHDINLVTDVVDNTVVRRRPSSSHKSKLGTRGRLQHLCLDKAYHSEPEGQELNKRGYVLHIPQKRKRDETAETSYTQNQKRYPAGRWVVERTNSWHNRFRKLFTRYEKKVENYLGLVQLSSSIIIYRKIILG